MSEDILVADWIASAQSVSRSTFYELIKITGIEPVKRREPGSRNAQSWLTGEQREQMDRWAQMMANGANLTHIRNLLQETGSGAVLKTASTTSTAITVDTQTANAGAGSALVPAAPANLSEAIQQVRTCVVQDGVLDPLAQAEKIDRAIQIKARLNDLQLALLLGEDMEEVIKWRNPRMWADGIRISPKTMHGVRRWKIERTESTESSDAVRLSTSTSTDADNVFSAGRRPKKQTVGFDVAANALVNVSAIDCTGSDLFAANRL